MVCFCTSILWIVFLVILYKTISWIRGKFTVGKFHERYILVTGCDSGFGNLLVKRLDQLGCRVFAGCLTETGAKALANSCSSRITTLIMDVTNKASVRETHRIVKAALPPGRGLWAVVNNAGVGGNIGAAEWLTVDDYKDACAVNLYGMIDVTMTFLSLIKSERGRVVNMSSLAGRMSTVPLMPYSVSKFGVESFSDGLRRAMHVYGVKVIIMEPGWTSTPLTARQTSIVPVLKKCWDSISEEMKEEYGQEYYNYYATKLFDKVDQMGSTDITPVIDALQHAILGRNPRARYVTGIDGKYVIMPLTLLPEWISDFILRAGTSDMPLPAGLAKRMCKS